MFRFLWGNLKGYRFLVISIFVATIFEVLASSYSIVVTKDIFNAVAPPPTAKGTSPLSKEPSFPFNLALKLYSPAPHSSSTIVTFLIIVLVVLGLLDAGLIYLQLFLTSRVAQIFQHGCAKDSLTSSNASHWTGTANKRKVILFSVSLVTSPTLKSWSRTAWSTR